MKFEFEDLKTTFEVPDRPTRRQVLRYDDATDPYIGRVSGMGMYERLWAGVCVIATNWQSEYVPALNADVLDGEYSQDDKTLDVVKMAGLAVFGHMRRLNEEVAPPNS